MHEERRKKTEEAKKLRTFETGKRRLKSGKSGEIRCGKYRTGSKL